MAEEKKVLRCSFCGKAEGQVHRMIQGPGVHICNVSSVISIRSWFYK